MATSVPYRGRLPVFDEKSGQQRLDLAELLSLPQRPPLWTSGEPLFWNDPHISKQMLKAHLDPGTDAASRKPETIDRIVAWMVSTLGLTPGQAVLDLGCGPGLYATRLARHGLLVTGVDYSRNSIGYAREQAAAERLNIDYVYQDYRTIEYRGQFDAAILIYYDFGVLPPADRDTVLANVHRALRPGGRFAVDVRTPVGITRDRATPGWYASRSGFWRPGRHVVSTRVVVYEEDAVGLDEYLVIDESGEWVVYRNWLQGYTPETIRATLAAAGFAVEGMWSDLAGTPCSPDCEALAVVARRV